MGHQIIKQPNGNFCIWSTIVDDFVLEDATEKEIVDFYTTAAANEAYLKTTQYLRLINAGKSKELYCQFAMTYEEALKYRDQVHGGKSNE